MPTIHYNLESRFPLLRKLDDLWQSYLTRSNLAAPRGGAIPIGGGDWMDNFFKAEAIRGLIGGLRVDKSLEDAIRDGVAVAQIAIAVWNGKREWQVRRWNGWIEDFLRGVLESCNVPTL